MLDYRRLRDQFNRNLKNIRLALDEKVEQKRKNQIEKHQDKLNENVRHIVSFSFHSHSDTTNSERSVAFVTQIESDAKMPCFGWHARERYVRLWY